MAPSQELGAFLTSDIQLHLQTFLESLAVPNTGVDFNAPAILRKWPSIQNERVVSASGGVPYLIAEGSLGECIDAFLAKPDSQRHLYELHTKAQPPLVAAIVDPIVILELSRLREFLQI